MDDKSRRVFYESLASLYASRVWVYITRILAGLFNLVASVGLNITDCVGSSKLVALF